MIKILKITIALLLIVNTLFAQKKDGITPIHRFLQENADSTMVLEFTSNWFHPPAYYMLSKKDDTLTCYTYLELKRNVRVTMPNKIARAIFEKNIYDIYKVPVDVNIYFNGVDMKKDTLLKFWKDVLLQKPWLIKDDSIDGHGCPIIKNKNGNVMRNEIYDGGGIKLYLITKDNIKILDFYAPYFYEEHCAGRAGRVAILELSKLFRNNFKM